MTKILDGKVVNEKIAEQLRTEIAKRGTRPKLVIIQVGDVPESNAYIGRKKAFGQKIGAEVKLKRFPETISQKELVGQIIVYNRDPQYHGIIVQMPIPKSLDKDQIIDSISPQKDVDGLTSINLKLLWENRKEGHIPATTKGILTLLDYYKIPIAGKHVVVVGRSFLVGKPTALAFLNRDATVTITHSKSKNLPSITKTANILVVAAGKAKLIGRNHVSSGQVVVDVGINVVNNQKLETRNQKPGTEPHDRKIVGDVDFESVRKIVTAITPVPGGIGPMTVASLFENLLETYKSQT
ncbi:hypothetical protein A2W70_03790 [Candidatus Curtissbacteria bacterium RIFCSPLOWO2_02_41_11]|uniref:Bifunctional protein FolD n=1 Tax=Candidatus Curtissbacteria bacterium RIFCSPLOWO2_02_41_11 TaxID=1797731 RepID=A0A1F5HUR2_9BACT|nr:MAG: hypothetical protein A2W70_03790 [Candidatus Curtissbacteria bacterium RIFCSPLOWO2_02_41_11]